MVNKNDIKNSADNKNSNDEKESFFKKLKNDKKYRAKVELSGYAVFIAILVIFLNVSNIGNNYNYSANNVVNGNASAEVEDEGENSNSFKSLKDNYSYNVDVSIKRKVVSDEGVTNGDTGDDGALEEVKTVNYNGKSYGDNVIINKVVDNNTVDYYKVGDYYYTKDGDDYKLVNSDIIYDLLESKYVEVAGVKNYIEKASLDHYTNYSSGKKEYVYNLRVSDVLKSYKGEDLVKIDVVIENEIINIKIDFTNLLKMSDDNISECLITYEYKDIDKIEEFVVIEKDNGDAVLAEGEKNGNS